jgi:hypothetical protein
VTFEEVLAVLLGWVGRRLSVGIATAGGAPIMIGNMAGTLPAGPSLLPTPTIEPSHWSAALPARIRRPKPWTSDAAEVARCRSRIAWVRSVSGLAGADILPGGRAHR